MSGPLKLAFLGAARQVTGSCYAVEANGLKVLVDCGLYQERTYLERNWDPLPIEPQEIDFILLTHAHLDHSGLVPKVVRDGFAGTILTTAATGDLLSIALMDAAEIQEEDAAFKKKRHEKEGRFPARPVVPLYTVEDVQRAIPLVEEIDYDTLAQLGKSSGFLVPILNASSYLDIFGDVLVGHFLMQSASLATEKLKAIYLDKGAEESKGKKRALIHENADVAFYAGKIAAAKFFAVEILCTVKARCEAIKSEEKIPIEMADESFTC